MMTLLREALSWNYVLVTAVISSLLAQFTKVILNLIILGKFIPERLCAQGACPVHTPQRYVHCWLPPGATAAQAPRSLPWRWFWPLL